MKVTIERADDYDALSVLAARYLCDFIRAAPRGVIALATGRTPVGAYRLTVKQLQTRSVDCSALFLVDVDEIVGLPREHPASCAWALRRDLLDLAPISMASYRLLDGAADDPIDEVAHHEEAIRDHGGLGLVVLGIGLNGHIALNEPGTSFGSHAHVSALTQLTLDRLPLPGVPAGMSPKRGLTLGIGNILGARNVLLLAAGEEKARILDAALNGKITTEVPASALQMHSGLHVIADEAALSVWKPRQ